MNKDYGNAQICLNGHIITYKSNDMTLVQNFCPTCGQKVIIQCDSCETSIRGGIRYESHIDPPYQYYSDPYVRPAYCYNCGHAFPWTKSAQEAAFELIELSSLDDLEKSEFKSSIDNLLVDSPKTSVSVTKFKKFVTKAGNEVAKGLRDVLVDVVSESVKKSIWG